MDKETLIIAYMVSMVLVAFLMLAAVTIFLIYIIRQDLKEQPNEGDSLIERIRNFSKWKRP